MGNAGHLSSLISGPCPELVPLGFLLKKHLVFLWLCLRCLFPVVNFIHLPAASTTLCYSKYCNSFENSVPVVFGNNF